MPFLAIGTILNGVLKLWSVLRNFKFFMRVLQNWSLVHESQKVLTQVLINVIKEKRLPHCEETKKTFDIFRRLLDADLVDIPGVDEREISKMFDEISSQITCAIEKHKETTLVRQGGQ